MKTKTDLRAGMTYEECEAQSNYWKSMAQSGSCPTVVYPPVVYPPQPVYPTYSECPSQWTSGIVQESSGGGYYGSIRGQDSLTHYFNQGYTKFYPSGAGVYVGQTVSYAPFPPGDSRAGKAACISSGYPYPYSY